MTFVLIIDTFKYFWEYAGNLKQKKKMDVLNFFLFFSMSKKNLETPKEKKKKHWQ